MKRSLIVFLMFCPLFLFGEGYLHTKGKYIYNGNEEEVLLRGIGTGNWMIQEGYMMQTEDVYNTQHEFRANLIDEIGEDSTALFYSSWLHNQMTRTDVDSMKAWGFNSIRVAMHYMWFTPPIDEEPVEGVISWIDTGFVMIDSLLDWCSDNEMYLILDMHAAPGGQGKDAAISDYDDTKESLWESDDNKEKLIALWAKLAERYKDEQWIGGYDMLNEPNWDFEDSGDDNGCNCSSNTDLMELYESIIDTIRYYDDNHIVIVEGNCWGNTYSGMTSTLATYDDNLAFSFHKYWNYNTEDVISGLLDIRDEYSVPLWLGESGENSNTWYTNAIKLAEDNDIGWSWWPVKKDGVNNVLKVETNDDYLNLIDYWEGNTTDPGKDAIYNAVMGYSEDQKIENCVVQYDVIDALLRQPFSIETKPYKDHNISDTIFAVDYDMGRNNIAYFDNDTANYNSSTGTYVSWNQGWEYRNDGVDIESCSDTDQTNGYSVGWVEDGEWITYTIDADTAAAYNLNIRYSSNTSGATMILYVDDVVISDEISFPVTGDWDVWTTKEVEDIIFPAGVHKLKILFPDEGINLNYLKFLDPKSVESVDFSALHAETSDGDTVFLTLNKEITSDLSDVSATDFVVTVEDSIIDVSDISLNDSDKEILKLVLSSTIYYGEDATISYSGTTLMNEQQNLNPFTDLEIENNLPTRYSIPGKIQVENYENNDGLVLEDCEDTGGGYSTGYAAAGDYLDFLVYVKSTQTYTVDYRVAIKSSKAKVILLTDYSGDFVAVDTVTLTPTGGWQEWETQSSNVDLPEGRYTIRLEVLSNEQNWNWIKFSAYTESTSAIETAESSVGNLVIYPNPATEKITIEFDGNLNSKFSCALVDMYGRTVERNISLNPGSNEVSVDQLTKGIYTLELFSDNILSQRKRIIKY